jgi:hypothetical protein
LSHSNVVAFPGMQHGHDAAGMRAGVAEDATTGLGSITDGAGLAWYWNTATSEWQRAHTIVSGDTLWKLSKVYYGSFSLPGVAMIHEVPQNLAIQGPNKDTGLIPGDVILIPGLPQPAAAPAGANAPPLDLSNVQVPLVGGDPGTWSPIRNPPGVDTVASVDLPAGWPPGVDYPPTGTVPSGGTIVLPEVIVTGDVPTNGDVVLVGADTATTKKAEPFWTGGRIAIGVALGLAGIGTIAYLATRKPKRRNPAARSSFNRRRAY